MSLTYQNHFSFHFRIDLHLIQPNLCDLKINFTECEFNANKTIF